MSALYLLVLAGSLALCVKPSSARCQEFTCQQGFVRTPSGIPARANGCGPEKYPKFTEALSRAFSGFVEMCNNHDICYGTCGASKEHCDDVFWEEMVRYCETWGSHSMEYRRECVGHANTFATAVKAMGCPAYMEAQQKACTCVRSRSI